MSRESFHLGDFIFLREKRQKQLPGETSIPLGIIHIWSQPDAEQPGSPFLPFYSTEVKSRWLRCGASLNKSSVPALAVSFLLQTADMRACRETKS